VSWELPSPAPPPGAAATTAPHHPPPPPEPGEFARISVLRQLRVLSLGLPAAGRWESHALPHQLAGQLTRLGVHGVRGTPLLLSLSRCSALEVLQLARIGGGATEELVVQASVRRGMQGVTAGCMGFKAWV
jgi:hypothetical protein